MEQVRRINFNSPIKADDLNLADYGGGINADGDDYCSLIVSKIAEGMAGYEHAKDKVHVKAELDQEVQAMAASNDSFRAPGWRTVYADLLQASRL
jgi:hypothetical protein